jgi:hypothetical protein
VFQKHLFVGTLAAMCAGVTLGAQSTGTSQPQQPTTQSDTRAQAHTQTTTLTGCVYRENDVPGRKPNIAERAGVLEDYILADARVKGGGTRDKSSESTPGAAGTSGMAGSMYKLEKIPDERLRAVVGKRVEVTGRIDAERGDRPAGTTGGEAKEPDKSAGPDRVELPEFEVTSIREIAGTCPATPAPRR